MPQPGVKKRLTNHLLRLNLWLETSMRELAKIDRDLDENLAAALERHEQITRQFDQLFREHEVLLREWMALKNQTLADRIEIMRLAERSSPLLKQYEEAQNRTFVSIQAHMDACEAELKRLGEGRRAINHYRPGGDSDEGSMDHRA
jgi:hypothetical protein